MIMPSNSVANVPEGLNIKNNVSERLGAGVKNAMKNANTVKELDSNY